MTKKDFEKIGRSLLVALPGFAIEGRLLFMEPLRETIRGIYLARSSTPGQFFVEIFIQLLCVPADSVTFTHGWRLRREGKYEIWNADAPHLITELVDGLAREAIPFLSRVKTARDVADVADTIHPCTGPVLQPAMRYASTRPNVQKVIAFALARAGDIEAAVIALDRLIALAERIPSRDKMVEEACALKSLLIKSPADAQTQLHAWEAETAHKLGLEGFRSRSL